RHGKWELRRSTSGGARRNGRESRLVLEPVGVRRGAPPLRGDGGVRHDGTQADAHGQADANRLREGGQYRPRVRDPEGVPHAGDDSRGDCERGRGSAGRAGSPRADDRDAGARQRADNGGVRRRQHDCQGAHVRPADAVARDSAQASYEGRAAALTALVHADSTARDSAVAWGLATPSYQDVIQEAAYRIIAQTRDTAAIPRVEERLATDRLAAHVLAALAARGS